MTETDWTALEAYIRSTANLLGLRDWSFVLNREPSDEGTAAQIRIFYGTKFGSIMVASDFRRKSAWQQKQTVAHELIHCHTAGMDFTTEMIEKMLHPDAWNIFRKSFTMQLEQCVEGIAVAVADSLPDIPWPVEMKEEQPTANRKVRKVQSPPKQGKFTRKAIRQAIENRKASEQL